MCRNIMNIMQPFRGGPQMAVLTNAHENHLKIVAEYCKLFHYSKTTPTPPHPLRCNKLEDSLQSTNEI